MYKKDDRLTLTITDTGIDGEGIGKIDGFTLFIKDAVPGDTVEAKIMKAKKNYAYARLEKVITPSPFRVTPRCEFARSCGGCQIQTLSYDAQLKFKTDKVRNNLLRIGHFSEEELDDIMQPIVGMEEPYQYRGKAQFPFGTDKNGNIITGFYAGHTHNIIANTDCVLGVPDNKVILEVILDHMRRYHITAYDETSGNGIIRHVLIRKGFSTGELMVCLVINQGKNNETRVSSLNRKSKTFGGIMEYIPEQGELLANLSKISGMTSISVSINNDKTNVIMGTEIHNLWGEDVIHDTIHMCDVNDGFKVSDDGITFAISPLSFYQVNPKQTERLYSLALEYANLTGNESVWDLYCGIGTISLFLAKKAKRVYGVEIIPQAIEDARKNAMDNGIDNATFFVGKAEEVLPEFYEKNEGSDMTHPDVIVVDPPRKGCDEACLHTMLQMNPDSIVYVSCDSATLARDLRILADGGYTIKKVRPVDMFPHSVHVETVCLLSKLHEAKYHVSVKLDMDKMDLTSAESKATYEEIKAYVAEHNDGMKVSNLYIAQVKRKCGLELAESFNLPKSEDSRQPQCPKEKEEAIVEALKAFQMIYK